MAFRTGIPFGYAAFAAALVFFAVAGITLCISGIRTRRLGRGVFGLAVFAAALVIGSLSALGEGGTDLNPRIQDASNLIGIWSARHAALDLRERGFYDCRGVGCTEVGRTGRWRRSGDFEVELTPTAEPNAARASLVRLRVVSSRGRLQLTDAFTDPDLWDGHVLFELVPPAV